MNTRNHFFLMLVVGTLVFQGSSTAFAQSSWVGEIVLPTKIHTDIKFGDVVNGKQVYFPLKGSTIKVRTEREGWLRVFDGYREGWVDKADFILARDAPAYFHRRVQANSKDSYALFMRGLGWFQKGEHDNAIKDFDECIRLNPTIPNNYSHRGMAWSQKKVYDKAIRDYNEALHLDPNYNSALNNLAWILATCPDAKFRDGKRAVELAKQSLELAKSVSTMDTLAAAYAEAGDFDQAVRWQEQALENINDDGFRQRLELYRQKMPYRAN